MNEHELQDSFVRFNEAVCLFLVFLIHLMFLQKKMIFPTF